MAKRGLAPYIDEEQALTNETFTQIYYRIRRMACNAVDWYELPMEIDVDLIEKYLFDHGCVAFFYDEIFGKYMVLPISGILEFDQNEEPIRYTVTGFKGYHRELTDGVDSILIKNNMDMLPSSGMAQIFASRLTNTLRTGDVHLEAQKIGNIVAVPEVQRRGVQEILKRIKGYHLFTIATPAAADLATRTHALETQPDYIVDRLDTHYSFLWHDCLAYFGIDSMSNKQSGVGKDEVSSERSAANANLQEILKIRYRACERINDLFGLSLSVYPIEDLLSDEEDTDDGELHNGAKDGDGDVDESADTGKG